MLINFIAYWIDRIDNKGFMPHLITVKYMFMHFLIQKSIIYN